MIGKKKKLQYNWLSSLTSSYSHLIIISNFTCNLKIIIFQPQNGNNSSDNSAKSLYKWYKQDTQVTSSTALSSHLISHHVVSSASKNFSVILTLSSASSLLKINLFKALTCFPHVVSTKCFYRHNLIQASSARVTLVPLIPKSHASSYRTVSLILLLMKLSCCSHCSLNPG